MGKKRFWILISIGITLVISIILVSNIIEVGVRLREIHEYVEYSFYGLCVILVYFLFVNPIRVIVLSPTFSVDAMLSDENHKRKLYRDAAKVLMKNEYLTDDDKELLKTNLHNHDELKQGLQQVFNTTIKAEINKRIVYNSKSVLVTTALSQNGNLDMLSTLAINLKMIKEIVEISGFRPSYPYLAKLSINVLITSLIAEGIEDIDISEYLPNKFGETLSDIPFLKTVSSSIVGGISNGLLTCRVGIITQKYLYNDNKLLDKKQIRRMAYKEALKLMPQVVTEGLAVFPKTVASVFAKPFKRKSKKMEEKDEWKSSEDFS